MTQPKQQTYRHSPLTDISALNMIGRIAYMLTTWKGKSVRQFFEFKGTDLETRKNNVRTNIETYVATLRSGALAGWNISEHWEGQLDVTAKSVLMPVYKNTSLVYNLGFQLELMFDLDGSVFCKDLNFRVPDETRIDQAQDFAYELGIAEDQMCLIQHMMGVDTEKYLAQHKGMVVDRARNKLYEDARAIRNEISITIAQLNSLDNRAYQKTGEKLERLLQKVQ